MGNGLTIRKVEQWALRAADEWTRRQYREDVSVEFKRTLPDDPIRVARRLAGHANAARTEPILWLIGIDEDRHEIVSTDLPAETADYWQRVWARFDGPHPQMIDLALDFQGRSLLALGFSCERVPYVVKTGKDAPRLEVPWREGTRVDSATRDQLIAMLLPVARAPKVETRRIHDHPGMLTATFFVVPPMDGPVMLANHRAILLYGDASITADEVIGNNDGLIEPHPVVRQVKGQGVHLHGPAEVVVRWRVGTSDPKQSCRARLIFEPGSTEVFVESGLPLR